MASRTVCLLEAMVHIGGNRAMLACSVSGHLAHARRVDFWAAAGALVRIFGNGRLLLAMSRLSLTGAVLAGAL